jgi:hypothetical protein
MPDRVRELGAVGRLEMGQQVELTGVVGAVAGTTERNDVERVAAPERSRDHVCRVDAMLGPAGDARPSDDGGALRVGGRHRGGSPQRRQPSQRPAGAQGRASAKRRSLHHLSSRK